MENNLFNGLQVVSGEIKSELLNESIDIDKLYEYLLEIKEFPIKAFAARLSASKKVPSLSINT